MHSFSRQERRFWVVFRSEPLLEARRFHLMPIYHFSAPTTGCASAGALHSTPTIKFTKLPGQTSARLADAGAEVG